MYRGWLVVRGVLMAVNVAAGAADHGFLAAVSGILAVLGDVAVAILSGKRR